MGCLLVEAYLRKSRPAADIRNNCSQGGNRNTRRRSLWLTGGSVLRFAKINPTANLKNPGWKTHFWHKTWGSSAGGTRHLKHAECRRRSMYPRPIRDVLSSESCISSWVPVIQSHARGPRMRVLICCYAVRSDISQENWAERWPMQRSCYFSSADRLTTVPRRSLSSLYKPWLEEPEHGLLPGNVWRGA